MEPISYVPTFYVNTSPYTEDTIPIWDTAASIASFAFRPFAWIQQGYVWLSETTPKPCAPKAPGHSLVGSLPELHNHNWDILRFLTNYQASFGQSGFCELRVGTKIFYIVSDPIIARDILREAKAFPRGESLRIWRKFSPEGLSEGAKTSQFRSQAQATIGQDHFGAFFPPVELTAKLWMERLQLLAKWGTPINLMAECERVTLAALGESLFKRQPCDPQEINPFNLHLENEERCTQFLAAFHTLFSLICNRVSSPLANFPIIGDALYTWKYEKEEREFEKAKSVLYGILHPIFRDLLKNPEEIDQNSKFYKLLQIFEVDIFHPDYDQMIDSSVGFVQAAFETSSKALGWILHILSNRTSLQNQLRSELKNTFGNKSPTTFTELQQVPLLFQVIEEALRLFTPFPLLLRDIVDPKKFRHYDVQKDGTFLISPLLVHRNAKYWGADAETFKPERWTKEMLTDKWQIDSPEYLTYLGGIHRCPGRFFAKQELAILLTMILMQFNISCHLNSQQPVEFKFCVTLQPKQPIFARLQEIEAPL